MEQFDELLRSMASKEECVVPKGFDEKIQNTLDSLPSRAKKAGLGAVKGMLIAAAACAVLMCTAFAASPELRGMLAEALGNFAPYAQGQKDNTYLVDGFELKVLSTLTDGSTLRAYVQVRDLEGDRLGPDMAPMGSVSTLTDGDIAGSETEKWLSYSLDTGHAVYDPESNTALLVFTSWAQNLGELKNARLEIRHIHDYRPNTEWELIPEDELPEGTQTGGDVALMRPVGPAFVPNEVQVTIPLTVESMPKLTFGKGTELTDFLGAELVELSPLGLTVTSEQPFPDGLSFDPIRVRMADGTEIDWENQGEWNPSGSGTYYDREQQIYGRIGIWNFAEAIDLDQVESVYVCGKYFPVK